MNRSARACKSRNRGGLRLRVFGSEGGLELRRSADGATRLRGRFPYGVAAVLSDGGPSRQARKEVFAPRAFARRVASDDDIHLLIGHDYDRPLASRKAGSLQVRDADDALTFEAEIAADLSDAPYVRDFLGGLSAGLITGLSPGFRVPLESRAETVSADGAALLRTVNAADLFEIAGTDRPDA